MKIATIYNDAEKMLIDVLYDANTKKISYRLPNGMIEDANEIAETLKEAIDDTYRRYYTGWDLEFEEINI